MGTQYETQYKGGETPDHIISSLLSSRLLDFSGVNLPVDGRRSAQFNIILFTHNSFFCGSVAIGFP